MKTNIYNLMLVEYAVTNGFTDPLDCDIAGRAAFLRFAAQI